MNGKIIHEAVKLQDPLSDHLNSTHCVIATMVKNEKDRIVEWIDYHFSLGFDKIIIFLNNSTDGTREIIQSFSNPDIVLIPFNYHAFPGWHWNHVQRIQLSISANVLRKFSHWVCFMDNDEFIYICDHSAETKPSIQTYMADFNYNYPDASGLRLNSYFFTNENPDYEPNQDVVSSCHLRSRETGYQKVIINSDYLPEFICTPHHFRDDVIAPTNSIYIAHYWIKKFIHKHGSPQDFPSEFEVCHEVENFLFDIGVGNSLTDTLGLPSEYK